MNKDFKFGAFARERRHALGLTQEELARRAGCAAITLRKIEAEDIRASVQIAERLAMALDIPLKERAEFVRRARAVQSEPSDLLATTPPPALEEIGSEDLTGRAIHGYALAERIGLGGMGSVYRAVQPSVEREVAIKIILPAYADHPDFIRRFEAEAQLIARLEHPHIVPLYDYWREPGVAYLVMRLLRGGSIQSLLAGGPLPIRMTARLLEQICSALHAAHRLGVIHRDLKPANVLLDEDRNAYLADFGLAKNLGSPDLENQTKVDVMIGSPQYMSPEQIRSLAIGPQTDIYCLGVMLYEMLTGALPFTGPTPIDIIHDHIYSPMPPLSTHTTGLPVVLDRVIQRATAKNPDERYPDALALYEDFLRSLDGGVEIHPVAISSEEETAPELANPFKGLRAFGEGDAEDFFGRETLVHQLLARLGESGELSRFLAVVGPSGSGKSSVVRAGLLPALRRGALPGSENWFIVDMLPGRQPFEELEAALLRVAVNPPASLLSQLKDGPRGLLRAVRRILPADDSIELVLLIDQFEELFTLVEDEAERALLLESLLTAILDERSRLRVVITLRADFLDKALRYVDFGELLDRRFEFVLPLTAEEVERAVAGPAQRVGLVLEHGLVATIISDMGDQPGALPLLQHCLAELFEQRQGRRLTNQAYHQIGGVLGALGRTAEAVYAGLDEAGRQAARQLFLRLVTLGEGTGDTRRRVLKSELEAVTWRRPGGEAGQDGPEDPGGIPAVIEAFGKARLLTFDRDLLSRAATVEVAHEALLREWLRLREWLDESLTDVRLERQLAAATSDWQKEGQDPSFLFSGARLGHFAAWAGGTTVGLTRDEQAFLEASLELQTRRLRERQRRRQWTFVGLTAGLLIALLLAGFAFYQRQNSQRQSAILLAGQAETELANGYHDRAVLLALQALQSYPYTWQAERALGQAVTYSRAKQVYAGHTGAVTGLAWSPDGALVASTGSMDNSVRIWDPATGETLRVIDLPEGITGNKLDMGLAVRWTPDGRHLVTLTGDRYTLGSQDFDLIVWDAVSGEQVSDFEIPNEAAPVSGAEISTVTLFPTGSAVDIHSASGRLATLGGDNTALIWDESYQAPHLILTGHADAVNSVDWSPDGKQLVTASQDGTAMIWDAGTGQALHTLKGHAGRVNLALWSPDGSQVATAGEDGTARLWDARSGQPLRTIETGAGIVWTLAWSPDGARLATGQDDSSLRIWDADGGKLLETLRGHSGPITHLAWSPLDQRLVSADNNGSVRVWNAADSTALVPLPYEGAIQMDISHDGRYLALPIITGSTFVEAPSLSIWDLTTGKRVVEQLPKAPNLWWMAVPYSPDDRMLLVVGQDAPWPDLSAAQTAYVLDAWSGEVLKSFNTGSDAWIRWVAWSPDGSQIATALSNGEFIIWDYQTGEPIARLKDNDKNMMVGGVVWSRDGSQFATTSGDYGVATIWDASSWKVLFKLIGHSTTTYVASLRWSPDGSRILTGAGNDDTGTDDNTARIWDATTGQQLLVLSGHTRQIMSVDWSPDGSRVVTAGADGTTRIWDASSGAELLSLKTTPVYFAYVRWSPDGQHLVTGGFDDPPRIWRVWQSSQELVDYAKECCAIRELTEAERQQYGLP